jgi:hypothetical protein
VTFRTAEVVNWGDLRDTVVVSLVAGVGLTAAYGFLLLGSVRAREHYDRGDIPRALGYSLVALVGLAVTVTGITLGLVLIAD